MLNPFIEIIPRKNARGPPSKKVFIGRLMRVFFIFSIKNMIISRIINPIIDVFA